VIDELAEIGALRREDFDTQDPQSQAKVAIAGLRRLEIIKNQSVILIDLVKQMALDDGAKAAIACIENTVQHLDGPQYLMCDNYSHCFVGSKAEETRWVMDLNTNQIACAEIANRSGWQRLSRLDWADLLEDLEQNCVREAPSDFGAVYADELPDWVKPI
jgi:hypothetical protein